MADLSNFQVTIGFTDESLSADERETEALRLGEQLREMDEVEKVGRIAEVAPDGSKGLGFLTGFLRVDVNIENGKKLLGFLGFLGNRLSGKTIEIEVEGNGRKLKVKASSREELEMAIAQAEKFIQG